MTHITYVTVRFCETDALGHVNNTSYFVYLEDARIQFFKELRAETNIAKWCFIVASTKCDFLNQAYFDQCIKIETNISKIGNKSFQMVHRMSDAKTGTLIALGEATIVYFNFQLQKSEPIPKHLREKLLHYVSHHSEQVK
jgi:acyl-CoA thioester hydrolase